MKRIIEVISFAIVILASVVQNGAFAQQYIAKCDISTNYWRNGLCNSSRRFKDLNILSLTYYISPTSYVCNSCPRYWTHSGSYDNSQTIYIIINNNNNLGLEFDASEFEHYAGRVLNFYINGAKSYGTLSFKENIWGGACNYKGSISFSVTTYDVPRITSVSYPSCTSGFCSGSSFCINRDSDNLRFNLSATNHGNASLTIYAYDRGNNVIGSTNIGTYNSAEYVSVSSLGIPANYNGEVRFRVRSTLGGKSVYGDFTSYYIFSKMLPAPTSTAMARTACLDEIRLTMPSGIAVNYSNYRFIWIDGTRDISLTPYYRGGNYIFLRNNSASPFPASSGSLTIQIADKTSDNCARNFSVNYGDRPSSIPITVTPIVRATFNGVDFHFSRKGERDGRATIRYDYYKYGPRINKFQILTNNNTWTDINTEFINPGYLTISNLYPDINYWIRAVDNDGCPGNVFNLGTLNDPELVTLETPTATKVTCHSNNLGEHSDAIIKAGFGGGIGPYTVRLYNGNNIQVGYASNIMGYNYQFSTGYPVGTYRLYLADRFGNGKWGNVTVRSNPEFFLDAVPTGLNCYNDNSGEVELTVSGRNGENMDYCLTGQTPQNNIATSVATFTNLNASAYTATVTDVLGCSDTMHVIVGQPVEINIEATGSKIARYGDSTGTISLDISGGTGDFDYILYNGATEIASGSTSQNATITGLYDGYYRVEATDDNGCPQTHSNIRVRQPNAPLELAFSKQQQNVDCYGNATGEVYLTATGGWGHYQYGFNGMVNGTSDTIGGLTASGATADTVFVVDSAGVIEKLPVAITEPDQLVVSVENTYNLKCFEDNTGAVKLNISGGTPGYRVSRDNSDWTDGDSISGLPVMDNQTMYVLDANDCPAQESITIAQPGKIAVAVDTVIDAFCGQGNGGITALVLGGTEVYSYSWTYLDSLKPISVNSNIVEGIYSGQYKLLLTDANGCIDSITVSVSDADGPEILAYTIDSVSCFGGSDGRLAIQQVDGGMPGYTYYLNGIEGGTSFEGLKNKTYHFRLLDMKGCKVDKYYTVPQPDDISISGTVINPVCHDSFDGAIVAQISGGNGGYSYNWSNNLTSKDLQGLNSGNYTLTVTDNKACPKSKSFEIIPPLAPSAHLGQNVGVLCTGNSLELDGGNFVSYKWYKDAALVSENRYLTVGQTGQYTLKISNELGCVGLDTFDLEVSDTPLDAAIIVKDSAMVDEVVEAIDVTWPVPDSIQWLFNYPVELVDNNNWMQQFSASTTGVINVTLRAWYGGCFSDSSKTVTIFYDEGGIPQKSTMGEPLILGYKAYPNPNDGNFYIGVELSRQADIRLQLFNVGTTSVIDVKEQYGLNSYDVPFNLSGLRPGVYVIVLMAEGEQQKLKIVVE